MEFRGHSPIVALTVAALAPGCGAGPLIPCDPETLAPGALLLDVPLVRQEERRTCGFAAAEMLSRYYGVPIAEEDRELLRTEADSAKGVSGRVLKDVLERNGFRVYIFAGELLDEASPRSIAYHLNKGRPVVVMLSRRGRRHHYMVVSGLDAERDVVVGEDPDEGEIALRGRAFRQMWERSNLFTLVAVPGEGERGGRPDGAAACDSDTPAGPR